MNKTKIMVIVIMMIEKDRNSSSNRNSESNSKSNSKSNSNRNTSSTSQLIAILREIVSITTMGIRIRIATKGYRLQGMVRPVVARPTPCAAPSGCLGAMW